MKKLFLALLAAATITSASAQPGSILLYGNLNYNSSSVAGNAVNNFGIAPGVGYQFDKNWTAGLNIAYNMADSTKWGGNKSNSFGIGVFGRYTHAMGNTFYCFAQADVMYNSFSVASTNIGNSVGVDLWPAIGMNLGKGYALNFAMGGINYTSFSPKGGGTSNTTLGITFGQAGTIGLSKNFGCKMHKKHTEEGDNMNKMDNDNDDMPKHKKGKKAKKDKDDE